MKKYIVEYQANLYGPYFYEYDKMILSEHHFLIIALWTAYKLLSRQNKIKKVQICRSRDKICLFKIERFFYESN